MISYSSSDVIQTERKSNDGEDGGEKKTKLVLKRSLCANATDVCFCVCFSLSGEGRAREKIITRGLKIEICVKMLADA